MFAKQHICISCGQIDYPSSKVSGSFIAELSLYIILIILATYTSWLIIIFGFLYSVMRAFSRKKACSMCKGEQIIPVDSPNGKALYDKKMNKQNKEIADDADKNF